MIWLLSALIGVVAISVANIFQRKLMKDDNGDPVALAVIFQLGITGFTAVFAVIKGFVPPPVVRYWPFFVISAILYGLGTVFYFRAAKKVEASQIVILSTVGTIVAIVASIIFLGESFSWHQLIGTVLIIGAILTVQKRISLTTSDGVLDAIVGTSLYGLAVVSDTYILHHYDAVSFTPIMSLLPGLVLIILKPSAVTKFPGLMSIKYLKNMFWYTFFYSCQAVAYYMAIELGANVSQISPIFRSEVVLTIILAAVFLDERDNLPKKILAAGLAIGGVLLIK